MAKHHSEGVTVEFYDDFAEPVKRVRGPQHAPQVDPERGLDIERRMAAMNIRRMADQHACQARKSGECHDPNHRRDMDLLDHLLAMTGLGAAYPAYTEEEKQMWMSWLRQSGPPDVGLQDAA